MQIYTEVLYYPIPPSPSVHPEMLRVFQYIAVLTCVIYTTALNWTARTTRATRVCRDDYRWRQVGECADTWYKLCIQPTVTMELYLPCNLPTPLCESEMTDGLTVLLFCDVHIDKGVTLSLLWCLHVICGCRTVQTVTNIAEAPLSLLHM